MTDYILLKRNSNLEYRLYLAEPEEKGLIFFKGHKMSIDEKILNEVIQYQFEVSSNKIFLLKYEVWLQKYPNEPISNLNKDIWRSCRESLNQELMNTWSDLLAHLRTNYGTFKNIWIVKIYI